MIVQWTRNAAIINVKSTTSILHTNVITYIGKYTVSKSQESRHLKQPSIVTEISNVQCYLRITHVAYQMNTEYDETNTICRMQSQETNTTFHHTQYTTTHNTLWRFMYQHGRNRQETWQNKLSASQVNKTNRNLAFLEKNRVTETCNRSFIENEIPRLYKINRSRMHKEYLSLRRKRTYLGGGGRGREGRRAETRSFNSKPDHDRRYNKQYYIIRRNTIKLNDWQVACLMRFMKAGNGHTDYIHDFLSLFAKLEQYSQTFATIIYILCKQGNQFSIMNCT
jgi:hypothetical protein